MKGILIKSAIALAVVACAGIHAREQTLIPAMQLAWKGIQVDVVVGIENLEDEPAKQILRTEVAAMTDALSSGDRERVISVDWPMLSGTALVGIRLRVNAGEIGPGVAESLRERIRVFDESWRKLQER